MENRSDVLRATGMGIFCAGLIAALLSGCGSDSATATTATSNARGTLIQDPPLRIASLSAADFAQQLGATATGQQLLALAGKPACGVDVYYFQYWTAGAIGEPATASGALMVPTGAAPCSGPRPIVLYAHSITADKTLNIADVINPAQTEGALVAAVFAAQGYIVVAPNYAGYDSSTLPYHPFLNASQQSNEMMDALAAARAALPHSFTPETTDGGKLFVTGYSEGGYVAMATVRAMAAGSGTVTASAPMSGPYALEAFGDAIFFGNVNIGSTVFTPLMTTSYQHAYGNIYRYTTDIYEAQYATNIGSLLPSATPIATLFQEGKLPQTALFNSMTPVVPGSPLLTQALAIPMNNPVGALGFGPANLVTNNYRVVYAADAALNPDGATLAPQLQMQPPQIPPPSSVLLAANPQNTLRIAFKKNDMRNSPVNGPGGSPFWAPLSPMLLCGGDQDPTVFFFNTLTMAGYWTGLPTGLVTALDVNAPPGAGDPFAAVQVGFQQTLQSQIASEGLQAAIASYHATVAPFCAVAARAFFSQF
jgi:Prolyl oligopeptidase family